MAKRDEKKNDAKRGTVELQVRARLLGAEGRERLPETHAYAFTRGGRLLDRAPVSENGTARLRVPAGKQARSVRVIVAPAAAEAEEVRPAEFLRLGGQERLLRIEPGIELPEIEILVPEEGWLCWLRGLCLVRGQLLKRTERDGVALDLPVCDAEVEIFEVDPIWIVLPRLPELEIERIRDFLLEPQPLPEPPGPRPPLRDLALGEPELSPGRGAGAVPARFAAAGPQPEPPTRESRVPAIPRELLLAAQTATSQTLRAELARFPYLVRPLLCYLVPRWVTKQLVATAKTDDCGRFHALISLGCNNPDTPDLYFRATQKLFGFFEVPIYAPTPVSCHTWWDYQCGTEVTLYTKHFWAQTCPPCPAVDAPPKWVLVMAVGNLRLSEIYGTSVDLAGSTPPAELATRLGLTAPFGPFSQPRPFGGLCRLRLEFDSADLRDAGVMYYRVSWRKGTAGAFAPLTGSIVRHYHKEVDDDLVLQVYPLGPNEVNGVPNLFEIPPVLPPEGNWSQPDVVEDTTNAKFPTHALPPVSDAASPTAAELIAQAGKYQLKVDLFDQNGQPVNLAAEGITFRVPTSVDPDGTVHTEDAAHPDLDLVDGNSFIMTLHVDNNRCTADLHAPEVDGTPADGSCGVLLYDDDAAPPQEVTMGFSAGHPNGFARYRFRVNRGIHNVVDEADAVPGGSVTRSLDPAFLGPCGAVTGGVAAYAEHLYVHAVATNGWSTQDHYDASDLRAFVLTPEPEP